MRPGRKNASRKESDSWFTPAAWAARIRAALGGAVDFDPCCASPQHDAIKAEDGCLWPARDGLAERWRGRVYCNPPYSDMARWWPKIAAEAADTDRVSRLLALVPLRPSSKWWRELAARADFVGVPPRRIAFVSSETGLVATTGRCELTFFGWRLAKPEALQTIHMLIVRGLPGQGVLFP